MTAPDAPSGRRLTLLSDTDVESLPDPEWLVDGYVPLGGSLCLYGPPGVGKTFALLSLAFSIATRRPFLGQAVRGGPVVLVIAEGTGHLKHRVRAVKYANLHDGPAGMHFVTSPIYLHDPLGVSQLCEAIEAALPERPKLVAFDTLARCMVGADENSVRDMGLAIAGGDYVRDRLGATVAYVHHSQKAGELERGSSALRAACDTMLALTADDDRLTLEVTKQKDAALAEKIAVGLAPVLSSCVLVAASRLSTSPEALSRQCHRLLEILHEIAVGGTSPAGAWLDSSATPKRSFYRSVKKLVDSGYVEKRKGVGYAITETGTMAVVPGATECHPSAKDTVSAKVPRCGPLFKSGTMALTPGTRTADNPEPQLALTPADEPDRGDAWEDPEVGP